MPAKKFLLLILSRKNSRFEATYDKLQPAVHHPGGFFNLQLINQTRNFLPYL
jgi:hypothetical protein